MDCRQASPNDFSPFMILNCPTAQLQHDTSGRADGSRMATYNNAGGKADVRPTKGKLEDCHGVVVFNRKRA